MPSQFDHRTFIRLDEGYDEHPKVMPRSDAAFRAHVEAMCWASRNEGRWLIPKAVAARKWRPKVIAELVAAGLFDDTGDAWAVHDYLDFNRSAEEIAAYRVGRREDGELGNHMRWHVARRKWKQGCPYCQDEDRLPVANGSPTRSQNHRLPDRVGESLTDR